MSDDGKGIIGKTALVAASVGIICVCVRNRIQILQRLRMACDFRNPLRYKHIEIIETTDDCQRVVSQLKEQCLNYNVLGFDCEWVTVGGTRRHVALLQLSSHEGLCALFRLCYLKQIPKDLRELLEDDKVIKVGVAPQEDAHKLAFDFGVGVASTLDLRFLATLVGRRPEGLAKAAKSLLNVKLDKNWRLSCSDWEAKVLNEKQLHYAANDALVAVEIFKKYIQELEPSRFWDFRKLNFATVYTRLEPFLDVRFKDGFYNNPQQTEYHKIYGSTTTTTAASAVAGVKVSAASKFKNIQSTRNFSTRAKALYDNCLLEAPDGELLCTIDRSKAKWYMDQQLGVQVTAEPFTVRLNFEPAGRAVGDVGRYYQTPKENQCVVCGRRDAYIRKNVVPREYRKHFPVIMKSHTSHDVLLLCPNCHQLSNIFDLKVRTKLAEMCNAPLAYGSATKFNEVPELRQLKSAARALLLSENKIPAERCKKLKEIVLKHYANEPEITPEILEEAANVDTLVDNESYCDHGGKVVQQFQTELGGLIELEKLWREHFLKTMHPRFLPELWNVNHNANRLEIRAQEGRIDKEDLIAAGLDAIVDFKEVTKTHNVNLS